MRCLDRDRQWVLISRCEGAKEVLDAQGRHTGRYEPIRSRQIPMLVTVSGAKGSAETTVFGQSLDYDRSVLIDDPLFDVDESTVLWVDGDIGAALVDGGFFDSFPVYETGSDADGGTFDEEGDEVDGGDLSYPVFSDTPFDHVVKKVARSSNYTLLAVKHVEVSR